MKLTQILPVVAFGLIVGPSAAKVLRRPDPPPPATEVRRVEPRIPAPPATPKVWFTSLRTRCTPAEARLATDLNPPPRSAEGTGYEAACFALARQIPTARALLLSLPDDDRVVGAAAVYEVAKELAAAQRHDVAGPLMELVLEFWPDHGLALYEAGTGRYASGDHERAEGLLEGTATR